MQGKKSPDPFAGSKAVRPGALVSGGIAAPRSCASISGEHLRSMHPDRTTIQMRLGGSVKVLTIIAAAPELPLLAIARCGAERRQ